MTLRTSTAATASIENYCLSNMSQGKNRLEMFSNYNAGLHLRQLVESADFKNT